MLKILIPTLLLIPTSVLITPNLLFLTFTTYSLMIATTSLKLLVSSTLPYTNMTQQLGTDNISSPLLVLTCWMLPLMTLASQNFMKTEPTSRKRTFLANLAFLQTTLIITFSTTDLLMFYVLFETTLIPTLILITRWGHQIQRLTAGIYFLFYTLAGSIPMLIAILWLSTTMNHTSMPLMAMTPDYHQTWTQSMIWLAIMLAFMVKMPLYGVHLWLPKAHVEAPIPGSMILAAILLKLGGYGIIRVLPICPPPNTILIYPFMMLALWGIIMTSLIGLRQPDLKALIAYSSVGHMGLVISATLIQTHWGLSGAMLLMIAHGLTSSALFCLANMNYERTHSRALLLLQGAQIIFPLMTTWWIIASLTNMALPPTINFMGELLILTTLMNWCPLTIIITATGTTLTAAYTLYMLLSTQHGKLPHGLLLPPMETREHLLLALHMVPLILIIMKPNLLF
uniref:NADH-ubiquinone oxidoreductase chain 4 n=1 Tax=Aspidoscelis neomexicanus TaxID=2936315 RepID=A0A977TMD7_9SAUR|nr:NADH dehydrogenase subunit 4 [Aspidoscelis neomexicanus]UXX18072.1 NADH dehydrogenase subunit 4 [Aspidoscelis neomexicanus]UXX18150.1 NADH dehydrogenase subunit 4 [Aspidoscelis tesselatus]UXX18163.1 NADH dehydrogenase subunit 4 [Aspidoscelis tesselatus]